MERDHHEADPNDSRATVHVLREGTISPDGRTLGYGLDNGTVHFVNTATGRSVDAQGAHAAAVQSVAFSPDSRTAVSTGDDGVAIVWDPDTGRLIERLVGHAGRVPDASFSPDGGTLYTASLDGTALQWDIAGGRRFGDTFPVGSAGIGGDSPDRALPLLPPAALSPDGGTLAARSDSSTIGLFSIATLARIGSIPLPSSSVISATAWAGQRLVVGADGGSVTIWNASGPPAPAGTLTGLTGTVRAIATSRGGHLIAAVDGVAKGFDPEQGSLAIWDNGRLVDGKPIDLHTFGNAVAFSADGTMLAVAADDGRVLIVDPSSARVIRTIHPSPEPTALAFSHGGTLATGSWAGIVTQWDPNSGHEIGHPILAATAPISAIVFDPTGQTFATAGGSSGLAKLWTTATLQQLGADLPGGQGLWGNLAFTPDGRYLLVVFGDGTAYRWPATVSAWEHHACTVAGRNFTREEWSRYVVGRGYATTCGGFPAG
jgi:WD40 repeat protein